MKSNEELCMPCSQPQSRMLSPLVEFVCISCAAQEPMLERSVTPSSTGAKCLVCASCQQDYPVRNGIPRFVDAHNYSSSFGFQWKKYSKTQLDSHASVTLSRQRLFEATGWAADMSGQLILEAGSGAGRFTECLLNTGARVVSFDSSIAVESNLLNNGDSDRLQLFQADIHRIPLRAGSVDKVLCLGVLQHTPRPEESFKSLAKMPRRGGELVIDIYRKDLLALLQWKYLLRPITRRMDSRVLHKIVSSVVPPLLPLAKTLRRLGGRAGARLVPIVEYSHLGLSAEANKEWAILDTFDMYSPAYDYPQSGRTLLRWFTDAGFDNVEIRRGPNGLIGKGRRSH